MKQDAQQFKPEAIAKGPADDNEVKDYWGSGRSWLNWGLATAFVVVVFAMNSGYAITNVSVSRDLGLTLTQVGLVGSIYTWVFALAQFGSGSMLDRLGARWCLPGAAAVLAAGAFLFANAQNVQMLMAAQVLMALGGSFGFIGAGFAGGQWFSPVRYGFMFAMVQFAASSGAVFGQNALSGLMAAGTGWPALITIIAAMAAAVCLAMLLLLRDPPGSAGTRVGWNGVYDFADGILTSVSTVAALRASWINALIGGASFGALFAVGVVWGPRLLTAAGFEPQAAHFTTSLSWLGLATGAPAVAWLAERSGQLVRGLRIAVVVQMALIAGIILFADSSLLTAQILFFAFGFAAGGSMLPYAIAAKLVPGRLIGTSGAVVNAVQFIIGGLLMALPGRVLSGGSDAGMPADPGFAAYQTALIALPLALGGAAFLGLFLKEPGSAAAEQQSRREVAGLLER